jgi:tetratricopeptide (TPR) repeat protein
MNDESQLTPEEYFERAIKRDRQGDFSGAIQDFTTALEFRPDWLEVYWMRANARHNSGDYDGELADVETILRLEPENERAKNWRELILSRPKTADEAFNQLLNGVELVANNTNMLKSYIFAIEKHIRVMPDGAKVVARVLDRIMMLNPIAGHMARGAYFQALNDRAKAVEAYTAAIQLNLELAAAYLERANTYSGFGHFQEALSDFTRVLELYTLQGELPYNIANVYQSRGTMRGNAGDLDNAVVDLTEAIQLRPDEAETYFHRGTFREESGDFVGAIADYTRVIEYTGASDTLGRKAIAYVNRGRLREDQADFGGAIADWETYLDLSGGEHFGDRAEVESWIADVKAKLNGDL